MLPGMKRVCFLIFGLACLACGGSDDGGGGGDACNTIDTPKRFELANIEPAAGSSVPNRDIVHRFTINSAVGVNQLQAEMPAAHTAGAPNPPFQWLLSVRTYESNPIT